MANIKFLVSVDGQVWFFNIILGVVVLRVGHN